MSAIYGIPIVTFLACAGVSLAGITSAASEAAAWAIAAAWCFVASLQEKS